MARCRVGLVLVGWLLLAGGATAQEATPWAKLLPDPDRVDWSSADRPGYRFRGMLPIHQRFYEYIKAKRAASRELSMADRLMIRRLTALRRWPEAPRPNEFWVAYLRYLRGLPTTDLNLAQRLLLAQATTRGLAPMDAPDSELTRRLAAYLNSRPFAERNWFERLFGRVEPWLAYELAASGADLRSTGLGQPTGSFPATPYHGLRITYLVNGATLGTATEAMGVDGISFIRRYNGQAAKDGKLTVSATVECDAPLGGDITIKVTSGHRGDEARKAWHQPLAATETARVYRAEVAIAPDDEDATFNIMLSGNYENFKVHALQVTGYLVRSDVAAARARAEADALWRAEVDRTLRSLGYDQTAAGRELRALRTALAGDETTWQAFVDTRQRELGYATDPDAAACRQLRDALAAGGDTWNAAARAGLGVDALPPAIAATGPTTGDLGGLKVGTNAPGGQVEGAADRFDPLPSVQCAWDYRDVANAVKMTAVWTRDGTEVIRSQREVGPGAGWVSFGLRSGQGNLTNGRYTVTLSLGDQVVARKSFVIGPAAAAGGDEEL